LVLEVGWCWRASAKGAGDGGRWWWWLMNKGRLKQKRGDINSRDSLNKL
jgi:hypothetical protein